ncbi:MAG: TetR/AcrR family transcriptional regulator [Eubacteriales bacterium]
MNKRQQQKENTRKLIIEAAIGEFAKNGLTSAKTSDIAAAANVSHGTVFSHFPTREILLEEVIEQFGINAARKMHQLIDENGSVESLLHAHLAGIEQYEAFYTRLISEASLLDDMAKHTLVSMQSAISIHLSQAAKKEMEQGKIKQMPVSLLFNTWIGLVNYYLMNKDLFAPEESVIKRYKEQLVEHYINLISN